MGGDKPSNIFEYKQPELHHVTAMDRLNVRLHYVLECIYSECPEGRERELAIQKLEECAMWSKKSITHTN